MGAYAHAQVPQNASYSPTVKCKVLPSTVVFDSARNEVDLEALVKGATVKCIVEVSSVWFVGKTFGISLRVLQVCVMSAPAAISGFAFVDDDDDDMKPATTVPATAAGDDEEEFDEE